MKRDVAPTRRRSAGFGMTRVTRRLVLTRRRKVLPGWCPFGGSLLNRNVGVGGKQAKEQIKSDGFAIVAGPFRPALEEWKLCAKAYCIGESIHT